MRKLVLMFTWLFCFVAFINAQTRQITGTVKSAEDGGTLPGVTIQVKGSTLGTISDVDGKFSLQVPADAATLIFTFVGMEPLETSIVGKSSVTVLMSPTAIDIEEVVVTAFGLKKEQKALGYSATQVNSEAISQAAESSLMNSLQGKVAGVKISEGGGGPTASTKVIIRGYSSLTGNNNPLYVVDGMTISNSSQGGNGTDFGNGANSINPEDIASVTILKGAAATALYGSRAANGVIVITTKSGSSKEGIKVELTSRTGFSTPLRIPQSQNMFGQGWSGHWATDENGSWGPKLDGSLRLWGNTYDNSRKLKPFTAQENNIKDFYDTGLDLFNSISLSGGKDNSNYYVSYSNTSMDGIVPTKVDAYNRNTFMVKGSTSNDWLTVSGSMQFYKRDGSNTPDGRGGSNSAANLYSELLQIPRDFSIVDFSTYKTDPFNGLDYFYTPYAANPYYALHENKNEFEDNRVQGTGAVDVKLTSWLNATARFGLDVTNYRQKNYEAIMVFTPGTPQQIKGTSTNPGRNYEFMSTREEYNGDFLVSAVKDLNEDFTLDAQAGYTFNERSFYSIDGLVTSLTIPGYYNLSNTSGSKETSTYEWMRRYHGVFAQATLDYKDMVYFSATARQDWSSTLPLENNSFFYPSVSFSLLPSEIFPQIKDVVTYSKIRASWGKNGNDADPYKVYSVMIPGYVNHPFAYYQFPIAGVSGFEVSNSIGNTALQPEISSEWEIGAEGKLYNGRIAFDVSYYDKLTEFQILAASIAPSSGYTTQVQNFGIVQNTGLELLMSFVPVKTRNFEWEISLNYTRNRNYILELNDELSEFFVRSVYNTEMYFIAPEAGEDKKLLGTLKAPAILKDAEGHTIVNDQGFPQTQTEFQEVGSIQPDYLMGISNSFKYKSLRMGFTFDTQQGGLMYSGTADLHYFAGNATQTMFNERQPFIIPNSVKENPDYDAAAAAADPDNYNVPMYVENDIMIDVTNINNPLYYPSYNLASERDRIISKSYVKLRELYFSYSLPKSLIARLPIDDLTLSLTGRNLLMWTPKGNNFVDPENTSYGNDIEGELGEFRTGPSVSTYTFGINVKF